MCFEFAGKQHEPLEKLHDLSEVKQLVNARGLEPIFLATLEFFHSDLLDYTLT